MHLESFCPSRPTEVPRSEQVDFVEHLLNSPKEDISCYVGESPQTIVQMVQKRGEELNRGNPWAESTAKRDALRGRLGFWKAIGCSKNVMSRLAYGKKLSFRQEPEHLSFDNHKSISKHRDFVLEQSRDCLDATFFRLVDPSFAKVINPIKVEPKGNGKWRMCHDLRCVNSETAYSQFRLSTLIGALPGLLQPGDELIVGDLTSAYYFVNMHESAWPYLCFDTPVGLMCGTSLLFGDGLGPFTFHKIAREIVAFAGAVGIRVMNYLDDWLWMAQPDRREGTKAFAEWLLPALGWTYNAKCDFTWAYVRGSWVS